MPLLEAAARACKEEEAEEEKRRRKRGKEKEKDKNKNGGEKEKNKRREKGGGGACTKLQPHVLHARGSALVLTPQINTALFARRTSKLYAE